MQGNDLLGTPINASELSEARVDTPSACHAQQITRLLGHIQLAQLLDRDHQQGFTSHEIITQRTG